MIDAYSKVVLTVIAVSLSVIATQQLVSPANASLEACSTYLRPCYVIAKIADF